MKLLLASIFAIALAGLIALQPAPATAQAGPSAKSPRVTGPVPGASYYQRHEFHNYLETHPEVANQLMKNPSLANDPAFLASHKDLRELVGRHPGLRRQLSENPGRVMERYQYHQRYGQPMGRSGMGPGGGMGPGRGMGPGGPMGPGGMAPGPTMGPGGMNPGGMGPGGAMGRGMGPGGPPNQ
jgi:hypothetical protein